MQYKIPVQIENEDPIMLGLSLRQLAIIMFFFGIGYSIYKSLFPSLGAKGALLPAIIIALMGIGIAIFKYSEMTFMPFVLSFIRYKVNLDTRKWIKGIDSYSSMDIGFISLNENKPENKINLEDKINKIKELEDKINKI